jgi:hypothetical protein
MNFGVIWFTWSRLTSYQTGYSRVLMFSHSFLVLYLLGGHKASYTIQYIPLLDPVVEVSKLEFVLCWFIWCVFALHPIRDIFTLIFTKPFFLLFKIKNTILALWRRISQSCHLFWSAHNLTQLEKMHWIKIICILIFIVNYRSTDWWFRFGDSWGKGCGTCSPRLH